MHRMTVAARALLAFALGSVAPAGAAGADETLTYRYDALGRLVSTTTSGCANNGLATAVGYDPAGNRQSYTVTGAGATGCGTGGGGGGGTPTVPDGSFETPPQGNGYVYTPTVAGVAFTNGAGLAGNGSAWGFATAPDGTQIAFLQATGSIAMSVSGLTPGASYKVSFWMTPRTTTGGTPVTVSLNGASLGTFTPTQAAYVTTAAFTAQASTATLAFSTSATTDVSTGIDAVSLVPGP
jgi:hypothetical protein